MDNAVMGGRYAAEPNSVNIRCEPVQLATSPRKNVRGASGVKWSWNTACRSAEAAGTAASADRQRICRESHLTPEDQDYACGKAEVVRAKRRTLPPYRITSPD